MQPRGAFKRSGLHFDPQDMATYHELSRLLLVLIPDPMCEVTVSALRYNPTGFPFTGREQVLRQCAEKCDPTGLNWLGVTRKVLCCNLDFCNLNGIQDGSSSGSGTATDNCSHNTGAKATINLITTIVLVFSAVAYSVNGQN